MGRRHDVESPATEHDPPRYPELKAPRLVLYEGLALYRGVIVEDQPAMVEGQEASYADTPGTNPMSEPGRCRRTSLVRGRARDAEGGFGHSA